MDSITQIALGASVAGAAGFKYFGRKSLLAGALLGTLPDLDIVVDYGNAIDNYTSHRSFSHSLFVLSALSLCLYFTTLRLRPQLHAHKQALFLVIFLALITHPLLDTFTSYGTQLLWPLTSPPIAWHSIFIIDPLYTLPLLMSVFFLCFTTHKQRGLMFNQFALLLSCAYLAWGQYCQTMITEQVKQDPQAKQGKLLVMPTPFNTLFWRVLSYHDNQYYEAFTHLGDKKPLQWSQHNNNRDLLNGAQPEYVERLEWFSHGWLRFDEEHGQLRVTDLRLGVAGYHPFTFAIADQQQLNWQSIEPQQIEMAKIDPQQIIPKVKQKIGAIWGDVIW